MSDWSELERLWQSLPAEAEPAIAELKRQHKWRLFTRLAISTEIVIALGAVAMSVWVFLRGDFVSVVIAVAALAFVVAVSAASIWARALRAARAEDPVLRAVELAVRHARVGVRFALATLWSVCAALVFLAVVAFVFDSTPAFDAAKAGSGYFAIGLSLLWLAVWLGGAIVYHDKRSHDLARLQVLKAALTQEG